MPSDGNTATDPVQATAEDHRLAADLATQAGVLLVELRRRYRFDGAADPDTEVGADDWVAPSRRPPRRPGRSGCGRAARRG